MENNNDKFFKELKVRKENYQKQQEERQNIAENIVEIYKNNELSPLEIELVNKEVQRIIRQRLHI